MGRNKIPIENKKRNILLSIEPELFEKFNKLNISKKSKFIEWLLEEHFNLIEKGGVLCQIN